MKFPKEFMVGAATAAHQVEGNNIHSDYWAQEQMKNTSFVEPSLDACDHYNRYEEDIRLMAAAGLNAYRFSIEWARIEPEEGKFDDAEVEHYHKVIRYCKENGVEPIVTLHHFSSPVWLIANGGWEDERTVESFRKYTAYVMERLGSELHYVCTINEANMGIQVAAIAKRYMMQMQAVKAKATDAAKKQEGTVQVGLNLEKMMERRKAAAAEFVELFGTPTPQFFTGQRTEQGDLLVMKAHAAARKEIRCLCTDVKVGLTLSLHDIQAEPGGEAQAAAAWDEEFTHYLPYIEGDDFLGVQNYTRSRYDANGLMPTPEGAEVTQMNYEFYPLGIEHVIRRAAEGFKGDLIVTENGIATADDSRRVAYIEQALQGVERCINDGLPVRGYMYWSLLDNFEWQKGYGMTFGLVAVDRATQKRTAKPSLEYLGRVKTQ